MCPRNRGFSGRSVICILRLREYIVILIVGIYSVEFGPVRVKGAKREQTAHHHTLRHRAPGPSGSPWAPHGPPGSLGAPGSPWAAPGPLWPYICAHTVGTAPKALVTLVLFIATSKAAIPTSEL